MKVTEPYSAGIIQTDIIIADSFGTSADTIRKEP
jgi:hypothetical protein